MATPSTSRPGGWAASWTQAITDVRDAQLGGQDTTISVRVRAAIGGDQVRVHLSNRHGATPLVIGGAALRTGDLRTPVRFSQRLSAEVPPGEELVSDPAPVPVRAGADVRIDVLLSGVWQMTSGNMSAVPWAWTHGCADLAAPAPATLTTPSMTLGDGTRLPAPTPVLAALDVHRPDPLPVVVCLGDSITAAGWPEVAAAQLSGEMSVVNRGIPGSRLLRAGAGALGRFFGPPAAERWNRDVLDTAGRTHVVVALGINDLGHPGASAPIGDLPTAAELTAGLRELAERAHQDGIGPMLATLSPFDGADFATAEREELRQEVNAWIRDQHGASVLDVDRALRDPTTLQRLAAELDSGDHLHPSADGLHEIGRAAATAIREAFMEV